MLGAMLELTLGSIHWCDTRWEAVWSHVGPRKCSCKIKGGKQIAANRSTQHTSRTWIYSDPFVLGFCQDSWQQRENQHTATFFRRSFGDAWYRFCTGANCFLSFLSLLLPFCPGPFCASFDLCFSFALLLFFFLLPSLSSLEMPLAISIKLLIRTSDLETSPKQNNVARWCTLPMVIWCRTWTKYRRTRTRSLPIAE